MSEFRINARNFFLTYPRCNIEREEVLAQLKRVFVPATSIHVARELHEDGTPHIHALVSCDRKYDVRSRDRLHLKMGDVIYEGDYQAAKNVNAVRQYIAKDDSPLIWEQEAKPSIKELLDAAKTDQEFINSMITNYPDKAVTAFPSILALATYKFKIHQEPYVPDFAPDSFHNVPMAALDWVRDNLRAGRTHLHTCVYCDRV